MSRPRETCKLVELEDGTYARVRGVGPVTDADRAIVQAAARWLAGRCNEDTDIELPERAQRLHGRRYAACTLPKGHAGEKHLFGPTTPPQEEKS